MNISLSLILYIKRERTTCMSHRETREECARIGPDSRPGLLLTDVIITSPTGGSSVDNTHTHTHGSIDRVLLLYNIYNIYIYTHTRERDELPLPPPPFVYDTMMMRTSMMRMRMIRPPSPSLRNRCSSFLSTFSSFSTTSSTSSSLPSLPPPNYPIVSPLDFGTNQEYSVIHTDRSLNLMSTPFQTIMRDLYTCFQYTYRAAHVVIIPGYVYVSLSLSVCVCLYVHVCNVVVV